MDHSYQGRKVAGTVSCWDRVQAGFVIGLFIGCTIGGIFGLNGALRSGLKGHEFARHIAKNMGSVGVSFGGFMTIGTFLRC